MSIIQEIKEEIKAVSQVPGSRDLTKLALLFLVVLGAVGAYFLLRKGSTACWYWIGAGIALCVSRLIPPLFRGIYRVWISLAVILGYFVSRALLTLIFFGVILPTGLLMKLFGKDPMDGKLDPDASSYWIKRETSDEETIQRYERQF